MSISVDYAKLESVMQFANFLDVLKNPQGLKDTLADLQVATKEYKALVEAKSRLDQVDAYVVDAQKQIQKLRDTLEKDKGDFAKQIADKIKSESEFAQYMQDSNDKLSQAQTLVSKREKDVMAREIAVKDVEKKQEDRQKWLDTQKSTQDSLQAELEDKAQKLKALLG